jgi:hypothetical protein
MLVRDVYLDCFYYEESTLDHYIHHLLAEKKISLDDDISKMDLTQTNHQKVAEMIQNNVLGFHKVIIFSLKRSKKDYVLYLRSKPARCIKLYTETFQQAPLNCLEYPPDFQLPRGNDVVSGNEEGICEFSCYSGVF